MGLVNIKIRRIREKIRFKINWNLEQAMKELNIPKELLTSNADTLSLEGAKSYFNNQDKTTLVPPMHPGCLIGKALEIRDINQSDFARVIGLNRVIINQLIHGKRAITPEWALMIEEVLELPAHLLLRMQTDYDLHQQRQALLLARKEQREMELLRKMDEIFARILDLHYIRTPGYHPNYEAHLREYYDTPK